MLATRSRRTLLSAWLRVAAAAPLASLVAAPVAATPSDAEARLIESLIARVGAASGVVFVRNARESRAAAAAEHLRNKYRYFHADIVTADDFIRLAATRSELTGKPYLVRLPDGAIQPSATWLRHELQALRAERTAK